MIEDDNFITTEEEKTEYIDDSILSLSVLMELLEIFENVLKNEEHKNVHLSVAWMINNIQKTAEKSIADLNFFKES